MHGADLEPGARKGALNLHEAARIERDYGLRPRAHDGVDLAARHGAGQLREFHRESAAEAAALLARLHLAQLQAAHPRQQAARRALDAQFAQRVAAVMERDYLLHAGAYVLDARDFGKERRELPDALGQLRRARPHSRLVLEQFFEMMRDHRSAGARGHDNRLALFENVEEMPRHRARLVAITAVEGRLAATGLGLGKIHGEAQALEHVRHGQTNLREELVDHAGNKERDPASHEDLKLYDTRCKLAALDETAGRKALEL